MTRRTFVTFKAAFPDEAQWTETGSPLVPDGKSICHVVADATRNAGGCTSDVSQHSFYGWAFEVVFTKRTVWCLLQGGDPWLLLVEHRKRGIGSFFGSASSEELDEVLHAIDGVLKQDARFSSIRWFTKQEYEAGCRGGADIPCESL